MTLKKETTMKTAIEWLIEQLPKGDFEQQQIAIKQALEMEKQQIKDAFKDGQFDAIENEALGQTEEQCVEIASEFAIKVLEFYHNSLFMIALKDGEAKRILNYIKEQL